MEDDDVEVGPGRAIPTDNIPVNLVPAKNGEIIKLGLITCRVLEDGSRTGRLGRITLTPSKINLLAYHHPRNNSY